MMPNPTTESLDDAITSKMRSAGLTTPVIAAFLNAVHKAVAGETGLYPEASIEPVSSVPKLEEAGPGPTQEATLLPQLAVIKLNGGLGTGMGLERAKSLIAVKGQATFLDFIARQILHLRGKEDQSAPLFYVMNSYSTQQDTLEYLRKYSGLGRQGRLDFLQSKVPKLDTQSFRPVSWPQQPELEWCPPGHGDLYPSLLGSGLLTELTQRGIKYLFVSNADNLGATVDTRVLHYLASSGLSFLMEVAERTLADRKGGHLARRRSDGRLLLREAVQCPPEDEAHFQDIRRHRLFNTNNLWIRLDHLQTLLGQCSGALPLPLIKNFKTVDPRNPASPRVLQLESAMGAAIECFDRAGALLVPRSRFAPVKTTSDLLALRSDAYRVTEDSRLVLAESRQGQPPFIKLEDRHYKRLEDFETCFARGVPSLIACETLSVAGPVACEPGVICQGRVEVSNPAQEARTLRAGLYRNCRVDL